MLDDVADVTVTGKEMAQYLKLYAKFEGIFEEGKLVQRQRGE